MKPTYFLYYVFINILETFFRLFPFPAKTGYRRVGSPTEDSPVLLTCNFHLTILRLKNAIKGIDCHLLVANSKGINVWCAAAGGHLNNHSIISVIKTSGIEKKVNHNTIILPQLAAPGVEAKIIQKKTGWKVLWGPVNMTDIPQYLENNLNKTLEMKKVKFSFLYRIEMAVMWIFLVSIIIMPIWGPLFQFEALFMLGQICLIALLTFITFPLLEKLYSLEEEEKRAFLNIGNILVLLITLLYSSIGVILYAFVYLHDTKWILLRWCIISIIMALMMNLELKGSTPTYKSDSHADKLYKVIIDIERCRGTGICIDVCPRNCFEMDSKTNKVTMPRNEYCVKCSACIVQCPFDALYFENPAGKIIQPDSIRKYKLNLMGRRIET